ncbi:Membrane-bound transcription factor site-1 protease [Paragonimus heterotremus]|uniref:Membrane-bound transcription factor site-1 protease n=1 Tax=Paragonimus heterotremus TaxID=100268 RepID=A0A8J4TMR3_9TREM|nr:Membrane-bound transcription factor site-1 protease [Paragonimus heterotremus]
MISDALLSSGASAKRPPCPVPGIAPQADLYVFRVFTDNQVSYTSWFLDAFNYAISRRLHVINLSVGGPDFLDLPFVDKVWELSSHEILLVSAIGNDGPLFGTLNNPADQMDVLGVGGVDATGRLARFSSRGMTTWALPFGYGQVKPDVVTFSTGVISSDLDGKCRTLSGTSVASPVVTGMVALLISAALERNEQLATSQIAEIGFIPINPASIKQALVAGATPLAQVHVFGTEPIQWPASDDTSGLFEQGAGLVDLLNSFQIMRRLKPQASLIPSYLDFTQCPFMWPYCSQPFYQSMQPVVVNVTILNSMAVIGHIIDPPIFHPLVNRNGKRLRVGFTYSQRLWPWTGYLAVHLQVESEVDDPVPSVRFSGIAEGYVTLTVVSHNKFGVPLQTHLNLPIRVQIIPTPNRSRRVLYDQFHSIRYPSGYIPRDDLTRKNEPLDWLGDHIHTNMRDLYMHMRKANYYVEILTSPFTCFDASNYGTLLLVDSEEEFFPAEIEKLFFDVTALGLSLLVFAEWYNTSVIDALRFFDTNTRRIWTPETGGSNLPALNNLLRPFGIEFGLKRFPDHNISSISGRGSLLRANLVNLGDQLIHNSMDSSLLSSVVASSHSKKDNNWRLTASDTDPIVPVLGLWTPLKSPSPCGRLAVFGDADCLSSTHLNQNCFWLVDALLQFAISPYGRVPRPLAEQIVSASDNHSLDLITKSPIRSATSALHRLSNVIRSDRSFTQLPNGNLPAEAYRTIPLCPTVIRGSSSPAENVYPNDSWYRPQPLLLHSPIRDSPTLSPDTCHSPLFSSPRIISDTRSLDAVSPIVDSFVVVYAGVMLCLFLLFRYVFPRTGVMVVRSIARLLLARPFAYWQHFIREREI